MKVAVIQFPGSNCDLDVLHVLRNVLGVEAELVWHRSFDAKDCDAAVLPGGFSYGDYLRAGIIAAHSPAMKHVREMTRQGRPIIGICNGFQILIESGLLPGALLRNEGMKFICEWVKIRVETVNTPFTKSMAKGAILDMPIAHAEGRYVNEAKGLKELHENDQIVFTYTKNQNNPPQARNPNGSMDCIAGICNLERNVLGLMPHPERASESVLSPFTNTDGLRILRVFAET